MVSTNLDCLPEETLETIVQAADIATLQALSQVSKKYRRLVSPRLFNSIAVNLDEQNNYVLDPPTLEDSVVNQNWECFTLTRHFMAQAALSSRIRDRCISADVDSPDNNVIIVWVLLEHLKENNLDSFSWHLGICVPNYILGPGGYLAKSQTRLTSLSLITDPNCSSEKHLSPPLVLDSFSELRKLHWIGLRSHNVDLNALRDLLISNADIFEELELEHMICFRHRNEDTAHQVPFPSTEQILDHLLPETGDEMAFSLPALKSLSLSAINRRTFAKQLYIAFNVGHLTSLSLRNCKFAHVLLVVATLAKYPLHLKRLELVIEDLSFYEEGVSPLVSMLESFLGLEHLHLLIRNRIESVKYLPSMLHHKSTLKTLIFHEYFQDDEGWMDENLGYHPLSWGYHHDEIPIFRDFFEQLSLDFLGLCDSPDKIKLKLGTSGRPGSTMPTFRLLHLRQFAGIWPMRSSYFNDWRENRLSNVLYEDSDFINERQSFQGFDFAQWAFGPEGLPQLQVLAFGYFSQDARFRENCMLMARHKSESSDITFRLISKGDLASLPGFEGALEFLQACPKDTLLHR